MASGPWWSSSTWNYIALAALVWMAEPWRPGFHFRRTGSRRLVRFGGQCTVSHLMLYLATNVDKVLVGRLFGKVPLALYGQAFNLVMKPVHVLITPLTGVMFPTLSRAAVEPRGNSRGSCWASFASSCWPCCRWAWGWRLWRPEAMRVLAGPKWADAGPILAILAVVIPVQGCYNALAYVFAAAGRTGRLSLASVAGAIVLCTVYSLGLYLGWLAGEPLWGIALGYTVGLDARSCSRLTSGLPWRRSRCRAARGFRSFIPRERPHWPWPCWWLRAIGFSGTCWRGPICPFLAVEILVGVASYVLFARRAILWFVREGLRDLRNETA